MSDPITSMGRSPPSVRSHPFILSSLDHAPPRDGQWLAFHNSHFNLCIHPRDHPMHSINSTRGSFDPSSIAPRILPIGNQASASQVFTPSSTLGMMPTLNTSGDIPEEVHAPLLPPVGPSTPHLIRLRYGKQPALVSDTAMMREVPAHLDVKGLKVDGPYALHTEYSSKSRTLDTSLLEGLDTLKASHRRGVPELWSSPQWSEEFGQFIFRLVGNSAPPDVIEIHPPFACTTSSIEDFLDTYAVFESIVWDRFPSCEFVIENRAGSKHPSPFLVSGVDSIVALGQALATRSLRLRIALDLPQVYTAHWGSKQQVSMEGLDLIKRLRPIHAQIHTLHLWGRGASGGAHSGGLDGLFAPGSGAKEACLSELCQMLDDGGPDRHLVLEVTRQNDMEAILADLQNAGFAVR